MSFITISVKCAEVYVELIISALFEIGFDSFQEFDYGFEGSCPESSFQEEQVRQVLDNYPDVSFEVKEQDKINWNEEWEKNYDPIIVDEKCLVRATFHQDERSYDYEIVVNPKMSFGTGHHATTYQILAHQMILDHHEKKVLDVGTGTGILTIMASKRGASKLVATDIDDWCIENSHENFALNKVENVELIKGEIDLIADKDFHIIIANINKNVLMSQLRYYAERLKDDGTLLLSGFYIEDIEDLVAEGEKWNLKKQEENSKENWAMLALSKQLV
ncbi:MAG: 50S ribosomal protein L11 methyltransferase [Bacteroidota bacterium]